MDESMYERFKEWAKDRQVVQDVGINIAFEIFSAGMEAQRKLEVADMPRKVVHSDGSQTLQLTKDEAKVVQQAFVYWSDYRHDGYDHDPIIEGDKGGCEDDSLIAEKELIAELVKEES